MSYRSGFVQNRRGAGLFFAENHPASSTPVRETWVICSPILEEKNVAHAAFVTLGRALADAGVRALRIDYEGHGDSDGDTATLGLEDWTDDVCDVVESLIGGASTALTIMGCRAGALIAARAAARLSAARLVAWCPVLRGSEHLQELLRLNLTTQMAVYKKVQRDREALAAALASGETVNIVGWTIGKRLLDSLSHASFAELVKPLPCQIELLDLTRKAGDPPPAALAALASSHTRTHGVHGLQFWIDSNYIDGQQAGLVAATTKFVGMSNQ